jgi:mono/diheme cytochrome c family protein/putative copper export protein
MVLSMAPSGISADVVIYHAAVLIADSIMLGLPVFLYICPPRLPISAVAAQHLKQTSLRILRVAGGLNLAATVGWLFSAGSMRETWNALCGQSSSLLMANQATGSTALVVHAVLVMGYLGALAVRNDRLRTPLLVFFAFEGSCSVAWIGRAVELGDGPAAIPLALDFIYKTASALWAGSFAGSLLILGAMRSAFEDVSPIGNSLSGRILPFAILFAWTLLAAAIGSAILFVGDIPRLIGTDYGRLVIVEVFLLLVMLVVAVHFDRLLKIRTSPIDLLIGDRLTHLRRLYALALAICWCAISVSALLAVLHPAVHQEPLWPLPIRLESGVLTELRTGTEVFLASILAITGVGLLANSVVRQQLRALSGLIGLMLVFVFVPAIGQLMAVPAYPTTFQYPPLPYDTDSISQGWQTYRDNCASCHGLDFRGFGEAGKTLTTRAADLTASHVLAHPPGDLFWRISNGVPGTSMPAFAPSLSDADRWRLVDFVRLIPDNGISSSVGPYGSRAPDFAIDLGTGQRERLRDRIKRGPLLLVLLDNEPSTRLRELAEAKDYLDKSGLGILSITTTSIPNLGDFPFAGTVDESVVSIYSLLSKPYLPGASEFLIDSTGFVRAIWRSEEIPNWATEGVSQRLMSDLALHRELKQTSFHPH